MHLVLQMYLKIRDPGLGPRRVQLARAIQALDARVVHHLDVLGLGFVGFLMHRQIGLLGDHGVAHAAFELIVGVPLLEPVERMVEPFRRRGLDHGILG